MSSTVASEPAVISRDDRRALAIVLAGGFMGLLDSTIVNVALPSMRTGLGASDAAIEWVVSGYALSYGLMLIPGGRVGDNRGHKLTYIAGLVLFTLASLACGIAATPAELVTARVVQGIGTGVFFPAISGILQTTFAGPGRSRAFGFLGATIGLATALGPVVGGLLIAAAGPAQGWRLVFLVNLPVGVATVAAAVRYLPAQPAPGTRRRSDLPGLAGLTAGLLLLLIPLVEGQEAGWPAWTWACLGASAAVLTALGWWEVAQQRRGGDPLIRPDLLRRPAFATGTVLALAYFAAFTSIFFTLSLLWQAGLGRSALATGLMLTPFAVGSMIAAANSYRLSARIGRRVLMLGTGLVTLGLALVLLVLHLAVPQPGALYLIGPLALAGLGNGLFIAPNQDFVLRAVPGPDSATAGGILNTAQRIGNAVGIGAVGTVLFSSLRPGRGPNALAVAFTHSAQLAMSVNVGLVVVAFLLVFTLPARSR